RPFFKTEPRFRAQLKIWPLERIGTALELLMRAELECKTTGMPAAAICARALMRIAQSARRS
ncbi:MAG: DNA polymerase III subunit delta, partial [Alphaproteobacteria bacterium]